MRILMTADTVGGVFTYAVELIRALQERDVEVVLATMGGALSSDQQRELASLEPLELHESEYALEWMLGTERDLHACGEWLTELVAATSPDCIHFNHFTHASWRWSAPTLVVGHSCVRSWWHAVHGTAPGPEFDHYTTEVTAGLRHADAIVAPTHAMLERLCKLYGPLAEGHVISNAIDRTRFQPRRKHPFIFAAGRLWDEGKNIAALDSIAHLLDWPVFIAGAASSPDDAKLFHETSACQNLGRLPRAKLARWLGRASIYALPARYEPFGLSILEAAAAGCALVLGRIPSLVENWADAAVFVDPDDRRELKHILSQLIADASMRDRWAEAARARAQTFDASIMAGAYLHVYEELISRAHSGVPCAS